MNDRDRNPTAPTCVFSCHWSECPDGRSELRWTEYPVVRVSQHFVWIDDLGYGKRRRLPRADLEQRGEVTVRIGRTIKRTFRSRKDDEAAPGVAAPGDRHDDAAGDGFLILDGKSAICIDDLFIQGVQGAYGGPELERARLLREDPLPGDAL